MAVLLLRNLFCAVGLAAAATVAQADFVGSLGSITAPAALPFSNATATNLSTGPVDGIYNFKDRWDFTLTSGASASSLAAAFTFVDPFGVVGTFGISNLQVNLLDASLFTVVTGWQTVTINSPFTQTVSVTPATGLAAGNYSLQIRGTLLAPPAAYSGSLIATAPTPVPLPAAMPLLLIGLGALGGMARRKNSHAAKA